MCLYLGSTNHWQSFRRPGIITRLEQLITKSPHQLFTAGLLLLQYSRLTALDFFDQVDDSYGISEEGPETSDGEETVFVPELNFQLSTTDYQRLCDSVDPLSPSHNYGIDLYEQVVHFIESL